MAQAPIDAEKRDENRRSNLRAVVKGFRGLVETNNVRTPAEFELETRKIMWELSPFRADMRKEIASIAAMLRKGDFPDDFDIRIARLALAAYLLDKSQEMLDVAIERKNTSLTALFGTAVSSIRNILDESYFTKTPQRILGDYLDEEAPILACAESTGVRLLQFSDAVQRYQMEVAYEMLS